MTSVNSGGNLVIGGGAGATVDGGKGSDGAGIKPTGNGTYTVYGDLTLPCDIAIPDGATVTIPEGSSLTIPNGITLTNEGALTGEGSVTVGGDVSGGGSMSVTGSVTKKDQPTAPAAPSGTTNVSDVSVTLSDVDGSASGAGIEYGYVSGDETSGPEDRWQADVIFGDLEPNTTYTFYARYAGNAYYNPSPTSKGLSVTTTKSATELGGLEVSGKTGLGDVFQYGDVITVTFTPRRSEGASANTLALNEGTATLTYTPAEGETVELATATEQADGSFELTYDTKEKKLPIGEDLTLTVSYGGSGALNPVEETVTLTLDKAYLRNFPTVTGSFVYGETLTVNYTPQDDETVTYQWCRVGNVSGGEIIDGATGPEYKLTLEDIGNQIYVNVSATDEWHRGVRQNTNLVVVAKAPGNIEISCDSVTYGEAVQPSVTSNTNTGADVTYSYAGTGSTSYGPNNEVPSAPGTYTVTATVAETATHTSAVGDPVSFSIARPYVPPVTPSGVDWGEVMDDVAGADDGGRVVVDMGGETVLPGEVPGALAGRDVTLVLEMGEGVAWEVRGGDVPEGTSFSNTDLGVGLGTGGIPVEVTNLVTGEAGVVQVTLAHDGPFGFALTLVAPLGEKNDGLFANLYRYDGAAGSLLYEGSGVVDGGVARLRLDHASQRAVALDSRSHALPFADAGEGQWYSEAVRRAWLSGLMTGYADGSGLFGAGDELTRAQMAAVLYNLAGQPEVSTAGLPSDCDPDEWYAECVAWALEQGIFHGYGDGSAFGPDDPLTREQAAAVLCNAAGGAGAAADLSPFSDASEVSGWAEEAVSWAVAEGVLHGHAGLLEPARACTRAEAAALVTNLAARG